MKCGLVIEGGARRCIYAAGVLDSFFRHHIHFDYICGVSAGAQVALDYVSGQPERSKKVIMPYEGKNSGIVQNLMAMNLERLVYEYPYHQCPLDFATVFQSETVCEMGVTDCATAKPAYLSERKNEKSLLDNLYASCSLPLIFSEVQIQDAYYLDGSISDAIPYNRAFQWGCDKVVVILAKTPEEQPTDYARWKPLVAKKYRTSYPALYELLMHRTTQYEMQREELLERSTDGTMLVFHPDQPYVKPFETNSKKMQIAYCAGYQAAEARMQELCAFLGIAEERKEEHDEAELYRKII